MWCLKNLHKVCYPNISAISDAKWSRVIFLFKYALNIYFFVSKPLIIQILFFKTDLKMRQMEIMGMKHSLFKIGILLII